MAIDTTIEHKFEARRETVSGTGWGGVVFCVISIAAFVLYYRWLWGVDYSQTARPDKHRFLLFFIPIVILILCLLCVANTYRALKVPAIICKTPLTFSPEGFWDMRLTQAPVRWDQIERVRLSRSQYTWTFTFEISRENATRIAFYPSLWFDKIGDRLNWPRRKLPVQSARLVKKPAELKNVISAFMATPACAHIQKIPSYEFRTKEAAI